MHQSKKPRTPTFWNIFTDSFANEYTVEPLESPIDIASPQSGVSVSDVDFIENEIRVILQKLKETTSPGSDDICAAILKECASALERPQSVKGRNSLIY